MSKATSGHITAKDRKKPRGLATPLVKQTDTGLWIFEHGKPTTKFVVTAATSKITTLFGYKLPEGCSAFMALCDPAQPLEPGCAVAFRTDENEFWFGVLTTKGPQRAKRLSVDVITSTGRVVPRNRDFEKSELAPIIAVRAWGDM
jgi:hypothetical protein